MTLLNPWGLLALLAIPVIVALHFFRQQRRSRKIGGLHLWDFAQIATPAGRRYERLRRSLPLLFQLLAALLLAMLLAGFEIPLDKAARHYSIIIDDSVSMQARVNGSVAAQRAVDALRDWAKDGDRFTLVMAANRPVVLAGPAATKTEFMSALESWTPVAPVSNFDDARNIAAKFGSEKSRIVVLTDNPTSAEYLQDAATLWGVGRAAPNNAIVFADRFRPEKETERIVATVQGIGGGPRKVTITAYRGEEALISRELDLATSAPVSVELELPALNVPLRLSLSPSDALAADDSVILVPSVVKPVKVYLAESLLHREAFERAAGAVREVLFAPTVEEADLVFTDKANDINGTRRFYYFHGAETTESLRMAAGRDLVTANGSAITNNLSLAGVVWPFDRQTSGDVRLALRSEISYTSIPLLYAERATSASVQYRVNLALQATNIFRHTAWPVLMLNIIEECRAALPGLSRVNLRAGEELRLNLEQNPAEDQVFTLWREGEPRPMQTWNDEPPSMLADLPVGTYRIRQGRDAESPEMGMFRVNLFSQGESDLTSLSELKPDLRKLAADDLKHTERNYLLYYAMLAALISCITLAWVYHDAGH